MTRMNLLAFLSIALTIVGVGELSAKADSLVLKNGNVIVGDIKNMDKGVLQIETPYSDSDFKIEWSGVKEIYTNTTFLVTLENGDRHTAQIRSSGDVLEIRDIHGGTISTGLNNLVYLREVEQGFFSRLFANIDIGYSLTKAQTQEQITINTRVGYIEDFWTADAYFNDLFSSQDSVTPIRRTDYGVGFRYLLPADFFLSSDASFLSNTEQALQLRTKLMIGAGNYIIHTNRASWGFSGGVAGNLETFSNDSADRQSTELYAGTDLTLFDIGDLNLFASFYAYPNMTESGRLRADGRFDAKYDLPFDLYIRAGLTLNYDNRPAVVGREVDYVFTTGFGWSW